MCECIERVNERLVEHNTVLNSNILNKKQLFVETTKLDKKKRGKPIMMSASFCPFCGIEIYKS